MKSILLSTCVALGLTAATATDVSAQANPLLGQITYYAFDFCPRGWSNLDGQILPINQNQSLYSLLGTTYGGDGRTTFALPDLRGRVAIGQGTGANLPTYREGNKGGTETNTMTVATMPAHNHAVTIHGSNAAASTPAPAGGLLATAGQPTYTGRATPDQAFQAGSLQTSNTGGSSSFNNMQPFLVTRGCIAMQGLFPSRN